MGYFFYINEGKKLSHVGKKNVRAVLINEFVELIFIYFLNSIACPKINHKSQASI